MLLKGECRLVSIALAVTSFPAVSAGSADAESIEFESVFGIMLRPDAGASRPVPGAVELAPLPPLPTLEAEEPELIQSRDAAYRVADHYDPADYFVEDLHRSLDFDPHAAFEYVRDRIALDSYAGVLRGHEGVLGARAGNALERALLLERLLEDMAYDARLVFGVADASTADALLRHALTWRGQRSAPEPLSAVIGLIPPVMERMLQRAKRDHAWLLPVAQDVLQPASPARFGAGNDRVPAAKRAQGSLTAADLRPEAVVEDTPEAFAAIHQITVSNGGTNPYKTANGLGLAVDYLATYLTGDGVLERIDVDALFWPLAVQRAAMIAANERLVTRALDGLTGARFFFGTPRIYVFSKGAVSAAEVPSYLSSQVDLLDDDISVVAAPDVSAQALAARRMWYGVFQSAFETTLLELPYLAIGEQPDGLVSASTRVEGNAVLADGSLASADDEQISFALKRALEGPAQVVIADSQRHSPDTWWTIAPDGMVRAMLAPGLGGVSDHTWWKNYTNSSFPTKTYHTSMSPDATHAQRQAYLDGTRKAYRSGGGQAAAAKAQRAKKGPSTPARRAGASRGGHLEDSLMRTAMLMTLTEPITAVTLTVVAGATVSFLAMFVYAAFI